MSPAVYRNFYKIIVFGILWAIGGILFVLIEKGVIGQQTTYPSTGDPYEFKNNLIFIPLATLIGGIILISVDVLVISKWVKRKSFLEILIIKSILYFLILLSTVIIAGIFATSATLGKHPLHPEVLGGLREFIGNFAFWSIMLYAGYLTILYLFIIEVSDSLGAFVFWNFLSGKYIKPKVEERVFMFLDLKGSTGIAERLGHHNYYRFLNQFFEDVGQVIQNSWGTIYQYVGDEVVIHWPREKQSGSIHSFFLIHEQINQNKQKYEENFGVLPEFRAGIHGGPVSIGEIGTIKKDILYIGDVLNASARIQEMCKEYKVNLLVSENVLEPIYDQILEVAQIQDMGYCELRGKNKPVRLYTLQARASSFAVASKAE